jgi:hypothetical protein
MTNSNNKNEIQNNRQRSHQYNANSVVSNWAALKAMATSSKQYLDPDNPKSYYIDQFGNRRYHTEELKKLADMKVASTRPLRHDGFNHDSLSRIAGNDNNNKKTEVEPMPKTIITSEKDNSRDLDQLFSIRLASKSIMNEK